MTLLLTPHNRAKVALQYPLWGKGPPTRWWAEDGLVKFEAARPKGEQHKEGHYGAMNWRDAAKRVLAVSQMILNSRDSGLYNDEIRKAQQFISDMQTVLQQARDQGSPFENTDEVIRDRERSRAKQFRQPTKYANDPLEF